VPQRPNFAQPTPALEQGKPVFPGQPVSEFVNQPEQLRNTPQPTALQQQLKFQQQQHHHQQQLLQLQQHQQRQNVHPHHQQQQQQQHLLTPQPQRQFQQEQQQSPFGADIVKSVSQQLHLSSNGQSNQQHLLTANNRLQHNLQQQPLPTPPSLFQQSNQNQQPFSSQQISPSQQPQTSQLTPATNNFSNSQKLFPLLPSSTSSPATVTTPKQQESKTEVTDNKNDGKDKNTSSPSALAQLPEEVPDDLRQQLLSSGILSNADIQILDYDKVGDIPIENLPPEALENFYGSAGAASAPVPSIVAANDSESPVEMKVVRYDPTTAEGQEVVEKYVRKDATQVDPVALNDSKYNRYLPLKVSGAQFPLPDVPELRGRNVTSVVVLAPVNYEFQEKQDNPTDDDSDRSSREAPLEVRGVQFVAGDILKQLVKEPTSENFKRWLDQENATDSDRQSIVLLVVG
jgi:kinesin family protein 13